MIFIYGLFLSGVCIYVGATDDPDTRLLQHRHHKGIITKFPGTVMRIFRRCNASIASRIEAQVCKAYRKRGQASLNNKLGGFRKRPARRVLQRRPKRIFESVYEAAMYFGIRSKSLYRVLKKDGVLIIQDSTKKTGFRLVSLAFVD